MNLKYSVIYEVNSSLDNTGHITREDKLFAKKLGLIKKFSKDYEILFTMVDKGAITIAITIFTKYF